MLREVVLYIAASLDGYIATKEDGLEWLFQTEGEGDNGYSEFYESVDTIIMGRKTYDWILNHEGDNFPYKNKQCLVFSRTEQQEDENVEFVNGNVHELVAELKKMEGKSIWIVGGGELLHYFIKEQLVDKWIINIAPTIIGEGIPLFKQLDFETRLSLITVKRHNQFAEMQYETVRGGTFNGNI